MVWGFFTFLLTKTASCSLINLHSPSAQPSRLILHRSCKGSIDPTENQGLVFKPRLSEMIDSIDGYSCEGSWKIKLARTIDKPPSIQASIIDQATKHDVYALKVSSKIKHPSISHYHSLQLPCPKVEGYGGNKRTEIRSLFPPIKLLKFLEGSR